MLGPQKPDGDVVFRVGGRFISGLEKCRAAGTCRVGGGYRIAGQQKHPI
jgi:hypothetical protein